MMDILLSLVFSMPLLVIMIYPALKITQYIETKVEISEQLYNKLTVTITIIISIISGILLHFA